MVSRCTKHEMQQQEQLPPCLSPSCSLGGVLIFFFFCLTKEPL